MGESLNKPVLVLSICFGFFYLHYWIQLLDELRSAYFNEDFLKGLIYPDLGKNIKASFNLDNKEEVKGRLVNWDNRGCAILLEDEMKNFNKRLNLSIKFNKFQYELDATPVLYYPRKRLLALRFAEAEKLRQTPEAIVKLKKLGWNPLLLR